MLVYVNAIFNTLNIISYNIISLLSLFKSYSHFIQFPITIAFVPIQFSVWIDLGQLGQVEPHQPSKTQVHSISFAKILFYSPNWSFLFPKARSVINTNNVFEMNNIRIRNRMSETGFSAEFIPNFWVKFLAKMDDFHA